MRIAMGSDHAGFTLKSSIKEHLEGLGHEIVDLGTDDPGISVDYPDFGAAVGRSVVKGEAEVGICICGTGIGISMAASSINGIRSAVVHDVTTARLAKEHNHANVICLGERVIGLQTALDAVVAFLAAAPAEGRHLNRIAKLAALDDAAGLR